MHSVKTEMFNLASSGPITVETLKAVLLSRMYVDKFRDFLGYVIFLHNLHFSFLGFF